MRAKVLRFNGNVRFEKKKLREISIIRKFKENL